MRIIFKGIYIQNQEIVKVDINQPWKMCYDEALKVRHSEPTCGERSRTKAKNLAEDEILRFAQDDTVGKGEICRKKRKKSIEESVYFCVHSAAR